MKRILYIAVSSQTGGVPKHILNALKHARNEGYKITVAVPNDGDYFPWFQESGAEMLNLSLKPYSFSALWKLRKYVKKHNVVLIHSHGKGAGMYARPLKILCPWVKVVHTYHGIYLESYGKIVRKIYCCIEKILKHMTDVFICVSESEKEEALRLKFAVPKRIKVICNGVEPEKFQNVIADKELYLNSFGFSKGTVLIGCVARVEKMKGHLCLIQAFEKVLKKIPQSRLLLVGDGPDRGNVETKVKELGLEDKVYFAGFRHDIPQILEICDVFVSASLKEGMPYTLIEALASGTPVVATDVIGNRDVIKNRVCGLLVPAEQPESMAEGIVEVISNKELSNYFAIEGQKRVNKMFTVDSTVKQLFDIYKGLIG